MIRFEGKEEEKQIREKEVKFDQVREEGKW